MQRTFKIMIICFTLILASLMIVPETTHANPGVYDTPRTVDTRATYNSGDLATSYPSKAYDNCNKTFASNYYSGSKQGDQRPTALTGLNGMTSVNGSKAYDAKNSTYAASSYANNGGYPNNGLNGWLEFKTYSTLPKATIITKVDFKVSYYVVSISSNNAVLNITYYVDPSPTKTILKPNTRDPAGWYNLTYNNQAEPNDGSWSIDDISKIRFRFGRYDSLLKDTDGLFRIVEVWITVHYSSYFQVEDFAQKEIEQTSIAKVEFKASWYSTLSSANAQYKVTYWVDPNATETTLQALTRDSGWHNLTWTNPTEPNNKFWTWDDIVNVRIRFTTIDPDAVDTGGMLKIVEVWIRITYGYDSRPTKNVLQSGVTASSIQNAYDNDYSTYAATAYTRGGGSGASNGYIEFNNFTFVPRGSYVTQVDFKVSYYVLSIALTDATLEIAYYVNPSAAKTTLKAAARDPIGWYNLTVYNQAEPNNGIWSWDDINYLRLQFIRNDPAPLADTGGQYRIVEVWITVHYVTPIVFIDPVVTNPIAAFNLNVKVGNVEELYGWEFKLSYNTSVLTATTVTVGPYLNYSGGRSTWGYVVELNDTSGLVWVTQTVQYNVDGIPRGSGTLATISFTIDSSGGASNLQLYDTKLAGYDVTTAKTFDIGHLVPQDAAVTNVVPSQSEVTEGETMTISVTVKNNGYKTDTFVVKAYANESVVDTEQVTLSAGASKTQALSWYVIGIRGGKYMMGATADPLADEIYLLDNSYYNGEVQVYRFGDANNDGIVDVRDLNELGHAYGSTPTLPNWNSDVDLNGDYSIGTIDLSALSTNYGKPAP